MVNTQQEVLHCDVRKVKENIEVLQNAVRLAEQQSIMSPAICSRNSGKRKEYWDWTTTQLDLVEKVGVENYIQSQI